MVISLLFALGCQVTSRLGGQSNTTIGTSSTSGTGAATGSDDGAESYDVSRSIAATHRSISESATSLQRSGLLSKIESEQTQLRLTELRNAIVRNQAARLALARSQRPTAMYLTIEGRRISSKLWSAFHGEAYSQDGSGERAPVRPEEIAAAGKAGPEADRAMAEAERKVPDVRALANVLNEMKESVDPD